MYLHMCAKTQPTAIYASNVIAKYMLETNFLSKLDIYSKYLTDLYEKCIHIKVPHMMSLQPMM